MPEFTNLTWIDLYLIPWASKLFLLLIIVLGGRWLAGKLVELLAKLMQKYGVEPMLTRFLRNLAYGIMLVAIALAALDTLGVSITSLLAILGAAGLAVGLALKNSLSNFAAGVMLILFRPFKVGDYVLIGAVAGTVDEISLFSTLFRTPDNQRVIMPNSVVFSGVITNVNALGTRRIDMLISIGYEDNVDQAVAIVKNILVADTRILKEPAFRVGLADVSKTGINLYARPWVQASDYETVRAETLHAVKQALTAEGITASIP